MMLVRCLAVLGLAAVLFLPGDTQAGDTLERVREEGVLRCGIIPSGVGLSMLDRSGNWQGFLVDMCRAVAAATTGDAGNVVFVEVNANNRFAMVRDGTVDVVMDNTSWTLWRSTTLGVDFPAVYLFDGQGFIIHRSYGARSLAEVKEGTVCVLDGTDALRNLQAWIARTGSRLVIRRLRTLEGAFGAFLNRHCDLLSSDRIGLHGQRMQIAPGSSDYIILPDVISKEAMSPVIRANDRRWFDIVRWVILAMVLAEEKGLTSVSAAMLRGSNDPDVRHLLGLTPGIGQALGLDDGWAWRVILQVGSYAQVFERNLGSGSSLGIERGQNALWTDGGLHYAPRLGW
jgi:general L-amino acid transport system substrate-binding protein